MQFDVDAFSSGQVGSKIWLAENFENAIKHYQINQPLKILLVGGWYGLTNFILQSRNNLKILFVRSIDLDEHACAIADTINEYWLSKNWQFKSIVADANIFDYNDYDCIINTSVEHIDSLDWFKRIPQGKLVALQSNNMPHHDHVHNHSTLKEFDSSFPLSDTFFLKFKDFRYPDWNFKRYMKIGLK